MNYKQLTRTILDVTFIGYLLNFKKVRISLKLLNKNSFEYVRKYWSSKRKKDIDIDSRINILVDALMFHPAYNEKNFLTAKIISERRNGNIHALIPFSNSKNIKFFANLFDINKFINIYKFINVKAILLAAFQTLKQLYKLKYDISKGIEIFIDDIEIGGLIYDEFLRKTDMHTYRKISFSYLLFIYRNLYLYYVYKDIINKNEITDIVYGHNVYGYWGLLVAAATSLNKDIKMWNWLNLGKNKLNIINYTAQMPVPKPKYYKSEYEDLIYNYLNKKGLDFNDEFEKVKKRKFSGSLMDKDAVNVFGNNKINSKEAFVKEYSYDSTKKNIFIYSHAFVDAVRYARWSLFSDYFTWLEQTLIFITENELDANIYIKSHPSAHLYPCKMTTSILVNSLNSKSNVNLVLLEKQVSNDIIFDLADLILTANGTVSVEAPIFGINVLVAGECDSDNTQAIIQPKNKEQYFSKLKDFKNIINLDKSKIIKAQLAFYWYNELTYLDVPISIDALDSPMINENEFNPWVELMNDTYKVNKDYYIKDSKILSALDFSIQNNSRDLLNFI